MNLDSWADFGGPLGGLPGRLGGFVGHLEAILGVLHRSFGDSWPSRTILRTILGPPAPHGSASAEVGPSSAVFRRLPPSSAGFRR
eukprot:5468119-Pyramimonas_sp.AAC.1